MITRPGIYFDMPSAEYFGDPCPAPSLTQSIAKVLLEQSPAHARLEHPRLRPKAWNDGEDAPAEKYDAAKAIGNAAHSMLIGRGKDVIEAKFDNWLTKAAKEFRDEHGAEAVILSKHLRRAAAMVNGVREAIESTGWTGAFEDGHGEVTLAWQEDGIWLRSLIDWKMHGVTARCYDYKSSGMSCAPHAIGPMIERAGWHIQAAMHERGLDALEPQDAGRRRFRFLAQENYPPYAVTPVELGEHWLVMGRKKLQFAIDLWRQCIEADRWPAYSLQPVTPEFPGFKEQQWLAREIEHEQSHPRTGFLGADHLMAG